MGWDLEVWAPGEIDLEGNLPHPQRWRGYERDGGRLTSAVYLSGDWQVAADVVPLGELDQPAERVTALLPAAKACAELHLEPGDASDEAYQLLYTAAIQLARATDGVCHDPGNAEIVTGLPGD
jgi:hypothetical protein